MSFKVLKKTWFDLKVVGSPARQRAKAHIKKQAGIVKNDQIYRFEMASNESWTESKWKYLMWAEICHWGEETLKNLNNLQRSGRKEKRRARRKVCMWGETSSVSSSHSAAPSEKCKNIEMQKKKKGSYIRTPWISLFSIFGLFPDCLIVSPRCFCLNHTKHLKVFPRSSHRWRNLCHRCSIQAAAEMARNQPAAGRHSSFKW